ncbi:MFS transporter [Streptomyces sp. cmx-18-6]|uniref:MFS transporter n=1 Tax=Streptomyces sp. cmx-18-6 TaxID=2790930 RepID=UPI0039801BDF
MSSASEAAAPPVADPRRWVALAVLLTATLLDLLDATIINIAIPTIQRDIGASDTAVQWITAGYTLSFAVGLITGGRLGDIFGRKRIFLIAVVGFTVASALSGIALGPDMLVASRVFQGLTAALMVPQVLAIMQVTFPPHEMGKAFGMFGVVCSIGAVSGPIVGALLTEWNLFGLEWRPIFLVNVPLGIAGLILGRRYLTESKAPSAPRLDLAGVALATLGLLMLLYPLTRGQELGWPLWTVSSMTASLLVFVLFLLQQRSRIRRRAFPLVELSLFNIRSFSGGISVQLIFGTSFGLFSLAGALYMQVGLGWTPLRAALTSLVFGVTMAVSALGSLQKLVPRFGRKVLQGGALLLIVGLSLYGWQADRYGVDITPAHLIVPLIIAGAGMGMIMAPLTSAVLSQVPGEHAGSASGLVNTVNQLGLSLGLGLTSVAFFNVAKDLGSESASDGAPFVGAFTHSLWWVIGGMVLAFLLMFTLPKAAQAQFAAPEPAGPGDDSTADAAAPGTDVTPDPEAAPAPEAVSVPDTAPVPEAVSASAPGPRAPEAASRPVAEHHTG